MGKSPFVPGRESESRKLSSTHLKCMLGHDLFPRCSPLTFQDVPSEGLALAASFHGKPTPR